MMSTRSALLLLALCAAAIYPALGRIHGHIMGVDTLHLDEQIDAVMTHTMQRASAHRRLQQNTSAFPTAPPVCTFNPAVANMSVASCEPSTRLFPYVVNTTNLTQWAMNASFDAVRLLQIVSGRGVCPRYNVATRAGADACIADTAHHCYLYYGGRTNRLSCSTLASQAALVTQACPGSDAYRYAVCAASNRTSCQANPDCIWSLLGGGFVQLLMQMLVTDSSVRRYEAGWRNASMIIGDTYEPEYGFCQYRPEFDAATASSNGTSYERFLRAAWGASTLWSSDRNTYIAYNGNCSTALIKFAASAYLNRCNSYNTVPVSTNSSVDLGRTLMRSDLPPNVTAIQGCIESKCVLSFTYTSTFARENRNFTNYTGFFSCDIDRGTLNDLVYNNETDGVVYTAQVECYSFDKQFDREACQGVRP